MWNTCIHVPLQPKLTIVCFLINVHIVNIVNRLLPLLRILIDGMFCLASFVFVVVSRKPHLSVKIESFLEKEKVQDPSSGAVYLAWVERSGSLRYEW